MLWDVLTTVKSSFESQLTLVGHWRHISGNGREEDDAHFERGRVKKAWTGILGISADGLPRIGTSVAFPQRCRAGQAEENGLRWGSRRRNTSPCIDERSIPGTGERR